MIPVALTIAGSDCCAGAGIQTDLKTFHAHQVYGLTAVTAIVSETPGQVLGIEPVSDAMVKSQVEVLLQNYPIGAIKTGMLHSARKVMAISQALAGYNGDLVIDPVLVATSGDSLASADLVDSLKGKLFPRATLLTPNLDELQALTGAKVATLAEMIEAAKNLARSHACAVLAKGGHLDTGDECIDVLIDADEIHHFKVPRLHNVQTHGTGCTLASAITARLAKGDDLATACREAQGWLHQAIQKSHRWGEGLYALGI